MKSPLFYPTVLLAAFVAGGSFVHAQPLVGSLDVIAPFGMFSDAPATATSATWGVNNSGQVAVNANDASGAWRSGVWTPGGFTEISNTLSGSGPVQSSGINDSGQVIGTLDYGGAAYVWSAGTMTEVVSPVGLGQVFPTAINNSGEIAGENSSWMGTTLFKSNSGGAVTLQTEEGSYATVTAINDSGQVVGSAYDSGTGLDRATIWNDEGVASLVTTPNMGGNSYANAINNSGVVVGSFYPDEFASAETAFVWDGATAINLGSLLASEYQPSVAYDVNDFGHVVGVAYGAFVYMDGVLYALEDLAADLMVEEGTTSGFVALNVAYDINNFGQIVGTGDYYDSETGMTHDMGFLLSLSNVPEPSASGALAGFVSLGAVVLLRRRRRA